MRTLREVAIRRAVPLLLLLLVTSAQAQLNQPFDHTADYDFEEGLDASRVMLVSGGLEAVVNEQRAAYAFSDATGFAVDGLERVCWSTGGGQCAEGDMRIAVLPGAAFGLRFPFTASVALDAGHALGTFRDMSQSIDGVELPSQALIASLTNGTITIDGLDPIVHSGQVPDPDRTGNLVGLGDATRIEIQRAGSVVATIRGGSELVVFEGRPSIQPFSASAVIVPFGPGATAEMRPASGDDASTGLDMNNLNNALASFQGGEAAAEVPQDALAEAGQGLIQALLNGAVLEMPGTLEELDFQQVSIIRFDTMSLASGIGTLAATMEAPLILEQGEVTGAQDLVTVKWFAFPWWSLVLWVGAIAVLIIRLIARPPRKHIKWDRYQWLGRIAGIATTLLVLYLWDREVQAVLGFSMLAGKPELSTGLLILLELGIFSLVMFATAGPLRLLLGNAFMLARQGRFMGLANPIASLLGFLLGAKLLLAYLQFILSQAV